MSSNQIPFVSSSDKATRKPKNNADIRAPKRRGTTDEDEGRRGLHRHEEEGEEGHLEVLEEGVSDESRA